jgi:predicted RNA-binding Zn ribbon-like protein
VNLTSSAELAVRLVNSAHRAADDPEPLGTVHSFRALLADRPELCAAATLADLSALRALRAELNEVFTDAASGRGGAAAGRLNALLAATPIQPELVSHDDQRWHIHLAEHGSAADRVAGRAVYGLTLIVSRFGVDRLGVCAIAACSRVFIDASTNRSRRYCTECASRTNVTTIRAQAPSPARRADHAAPAAS